MAKQLPKKAEESTGEWLNTYADMVTLLLTFFVLLFACSSMDESKMQYIVQAFQMRGKFVNPFVVDQNHKDSDSTEGFTDEPGSKGDSGEMPKSYDDLYQYLQKYIADNNLGQSVSVSDGPSHITIRFDDAILFDGDSWVLKNEGRQVIAGFVPAIKKVEGSIQSLTVSGHTAKVPFPIINDYTLSANRAVSVQNFLEFRGTVSPEKYIVTGYGPNKPLEGADNNTDEGRAKNRRVELLLMKSQKVSDILNNTDVIKDILSEAGFDVGEFDQHQEPVDIDLLPDGSAEKIAALITNRFEGGSVLGSGYGPGSTDASEFIVEDEKESSSE